MAPRRTRAERRSLRTMKRKVLFLCTGNSARSQMAEAIVNARLGDEWEAVSAGTEPAGYVHPLAVRVLAEIGIEHEGRSKSALEFRGRRVRPGGDRLRRRGRELPGVAGKGQAGSPGLPRPGPGHRYGGRDPGGLSRRARRDRRAGAGPSPAGRSERSVRSWGPRRKTLIRDRGETK